MEVTIIKDNAGSKHLLENIMLQKFQFDNKIRILAQYVNQRQK